MQQIIKNHNIITTKKKKRDHSYQKPITKFHRNPIKFKHQISPNFTIKPKYQILFFQKKKNNNNRGLTVHWHGEYQPEELGGNLGNKAQHQAADNNPTFLISLTLLYHSSSYQSPNPFRRGMV